MDFSWKPSAQGNAQAQPATQNNGSSPVSAIKIDDTATKTPAENMQPAIKPFEVPTMADNATLKPDVMPAASMSDDFSLPKNNSPFDNDFKIDKSTIDSGEPKKDTFSLDKAEESPISEFEAEDNEAKENIKAAEATKEPEEKKPEMFSAPANTNSKSLDEIEKQISAQKDKLDTQIKDLTTKKTKLDEILGKIKTLKTQEADILSQASLIVQ
jgi:hypothetical protein